MGQPPASLVAEWYRRLSESGFDDIEVRVERGGVRERTWTSRERQMPRSLPSGEERASDESSLMSTARGGAWASGTPDWRLHVHKLPKRIRYREMLEYARSVNSLPLAAVKFGVHVETLQVWARKATTWGTDRAAERREAARRRAYYEARRHIYLPASLRRLWGLE